jgi:hypothetical protein
MDSPARQVAEYEAELHTEFLAHPVDYGCRVCGVWALAVAVLDEGDLGSRLSKLVILHAHRNRERVESATHVWPAGAVGLIESPWTALGTRPSTDCLLSIRCAGRDRPTRPFQILNIESVSCCVVARMRHATVGRAKLPRIRMPVAQLASSSNTTVTARWEEPALTDIGCLSW